MDQSNHSVKQMTTYKHFLILLVLIPIFLACNSPSDNGTKSSSENSSSSNFEQTIIEKEIDLYEKALENDNIEKIDLVKFKDITEPTQNNELIYFGRATCIYCRKLIIENEEAIKSSPIKIFYVDTDLLTSEDKKELADFQVTEVPSFIEINDNLEYVKVDLEEFERRIHDE